LEYGLPSPLGRILSRDKKISRTFDKAVLILNLATLRITELIHTTEDNWIIYELMMQHKHKLDDQMDVLIKEKKKLINCDPPQQEVLLTGHSV
jgi:hypothetical protein